MIFALFSRLESIEYVMLSFADAESDELCSRALYNSSAVKQFSKKWSESSMFLNR